MERDIFYRMSNETAEDAVAKDAASSDRELIEHNEMTDINLHAVDSISDLHFASSRHEDPKESEGSSQPQAFSPLGASFKPLPFPDEEGSSPFSLHRLPLLPACPCFPCLRPTCCSTIFFVLLGVLVLASLGLATLAVYLSVLQRESLRVLAQWLEDQEETIRQMRAVSLQLWRQLNASELGVQS